ncbi:MAG: gamma-glutamyltransferase family protein [Proteobacteria bacterium]|nr:gamma-glutamyltransferase family protein [Pseudomonadota bacterium]
MARDFHLPCRSPVLADSGMAATSHPLASLAAIDVLKAGGNAADAAVTAVALLGIVEPHMSGIGGDCFCVVAKPGVPLWGYNGSGRAAARAGTPALLAQGLTSIGPDCVHAVTVPGAVEAWAAIVARHGRFGLDRALAPAIRHARDGFPVAARVAHDWALAVARLARDPGAARHYLPRARAPAMGERMRFLALADTLEAIARRGPTAFYRGAIADDIVATLAARGGLISTDDLACHAGEVVAPISGNYRGLDIVELPPNGQGIAALVLLNILETFAIGRLDPFGSDFLHLALEAGRLAYALRDAHVADPEAMRVPVPALLDKAYARSLAARIDPARRADVADISAPANDTVLATVVDRDRMAVSIINSLYASFGVGIATQETGILLHNRGACFVLDPGHPNTIAPGRRPLHTIIPALGLREGRCELAFGVMGGGYQAMGHAHVVANMIDFGMDPQAALDAPRAFFEAGKTMVERGVSAATVAGLARRGHDVMPRPLPYGGGQAVAIDWQRGVLIGASDHRKDGCALGY